jgi:DNA-binding ferritin-like protein
MTLLSGIRNLITRRKPLAIDISGPPAQHLIKEDEAVERVEIKPTAPQLEVGLVSAKVDVLGERIEELNERIEGIGERIDVLGDNNSAPPDELRRLAQHMDQLPLILKEAAEIKGQGAQILDLFGEQLSLASHREDSVTDAVSGVVNNAVKKMTAASSHDGEVLDRIQQQLDSTAEAIRAAGETDEGVNQSLRDVMENSTRLKTSIVQLQQSGEQREAELRRQLAANKRSMLMLAAACSMAALLALVLALIALAN